LLPHARKIFFVVCCALTIVCASALVRSQSATSHRVTLTPERATNLNPSLSGDGRHLVFESTANLITSDEATKFRAFTADLSDESPTFALLAVSRAPAAAISQDGASIAFASVEDLTGENADRNSEIFLSSADQLRQLTHTTPADPSSRLHDGNFQPSISDDARLIAFSSNRDLTGANADANAEIFLYDVVTQNFAQLTNTNGTLGARDAKMSGDGSRLFFVSDDAPAASQTPRLNLLLCELSDKNFSTLAANVTGLALSPARSVSDDGSRLVFSAETATNTTQVFLYDGRNGGVVRQLTKLNSRASDVPLNPTISGDGSRIAFATRRNVVGGNSDASVELYLYDIPTNQLTRVTDAPAAATAEVVSSLNNDGSLVAFNFPRVLAGAVASDEFANNSEIFLATLPARAPFSNDLRLRHGATPDRDLSAGKPLAPGQLAIARGVNLAFATAQTQRLTDGSFPRAFKNTSVSVNGRAAQLLFVSPAQINFQIPDETEIGVAQIVVRNHDGYESRTTAQVARSAPGIFTERGDGAGAGVVLDSATLLRPPFDPHDAADGSRRITIFATGTRHAVSINASIAGRAVAVESVLPSPDLPGLDEVRVVLPRSLAGAGVVPLSINADGRASNEATIDLVGSRRPARVVLAPSSADLAIGRSLAFNASVFDEDGIEITNAPLVFSSDDASVATVDDAGRVHALREGATKIRASAGVASAEATLRVHALTLAINEVLADPPGGAVGDANRDGVRSASQDEFVEIVNASDEDIDLGGYRLTTRDANGTDTTRHTFVRGAILAPGTAVVVFGGASAANFNPRDAAFGGALVLTASTGSLSLVNGGDTVALLDPAGALVEEMTYGGTTPLEGDRNQSLTRAPDIFGDFALHQPLAEAAGRLFSPGTRIDGTPFHTTAPVAHIRVDPAHAEAQAGASQRFTARAFDEMGRELRGIISRWHTSDETIATIDQDGNARALKVGAVEITVEARGTRSAPASLTVVPLPPRIARVEITPSMASINRGGSLQLGAHAFDREGRAVTDATFTWSSDDTSILTINAAGLAHGVGLGTAHITVTTDDGAGAAVAARADVEVRVPVLINEILADVPPDSANTANVEGDANRDGVRGAGDDEFIELLNNSDALLDLSGVVVADSTSNRFTFPANATLAAGQAVVIFGGGSPPSHDPAFGGALVFAASSLGLNDGGDTVTIKLRSSGGDTLIASQSYGNAATTAPPAPTDQSLTRAPDAEIGSSGGSFVAHASAANAAARVFSPGTRVDGTPFGSPPLTRIEVAPASARLDIGAHQTFSARAFASSGGAEIEIANVSFAWDATDTTKVTLAPQTGAGTTATALAAGTTSVRARAGGLQVTVSLVVNPPPPVLTRVDLAPATSNINVGQTQQFTARSFDQFNQPFAGATFDFTSDDASVARVVSTTSGGDGSAIAFVSGRGVGTAHLTAKATSGENAAVSNTATLTVNPPPPVLSRIVVSPASATIAAGETQQFTARGFDQNDQEISGLAFAWASSDQSVATINQSGLATATKAGDAQINASSAGITSAPAVLHINAPPVAAAGQVIINEALVSFATSTTQARADFLELFNTTGQTLDISGLVVSFRASGNTSAVSVAALPGAAGSRTTLIAPHAYFLIANGASTFGVAADFDASASGFDLNNSSGAIKVELNGTKLDGLRYQQNGNAVPPAPFNNFGEGTIFTFAGGTPNDLIRSPNATDTNNNATDFKRNNTTASISPKAANP
jgi:uncharacterized protein (TIGR03437 family)